MKKETKSIDKKVDYNELKEQTLDAINYIYCARNCPVFPTISKELDSYSKQLMTEMRIYHKNKVKLQKANLWDSRYDTCYKKAIDRILSLEMFTELKDELFLK